MKLLIRETGKIEELNYITKSGEDQAGDLIGMGTDIDFFYDRESGIYVCSQETFDWWHDKILRYEEMNEVVEEATEILGADVVNQVLEDHEDYGIENGPYFVIEELTTLMDEAGASL